MLAAGLQYAALQCTPCACTPVPWLSGPRSTNCNWRIHQECANYNLLNEALTTRGLVHIHKLADSHKITLYQSYVSIMKACHPVVQWTNIAAGAALAQGGCSAADQQPWLFCCRQLQVVGVIKECGEHHQQGPHIPCLTPTFLGDTNNLQLLSAKQPWLLVIATMPCTRYTAVHTAEPAQPPAAPLQVVRSTQHGHLSQHACWFPSTKTWSTGCCCCLTPPPHPLTKPCPLHMHHTLDPSGRKASCSFSNLILSNTCCVLCAAARRV